MKDLCPCCSQKLYSDCCEKFHKDLAKPCPVELMRSRYSAYVLSLSDYIMKTTHKKSPHFDKNSRRWSLSILEFCQNTSFLGLEILSSSINKNLAYVTFFAKLTQQDQEASFTEKSTFKYTQDRWFYDVGITEPGLALHLR